MQSANRTCTDASSFGDDPGVARKPRKVGRCDDAFEFGRKFTLPVTRLALDGVLCALDNRGAPSFAALRSAVASNTTATVVLMSSSWPRRW